MNPHRLVIQFFLGLARFSIQRPKLVLILATLLTLASAPGLWRLQLRTDGHALVSPTAPEVQFDQSIRDRFGIEDQIVVLIQSEHAKGIYNTNTIELIRDLTEALRGLPGINPSNVISLATEPGFHVRPGTLIRQRLLEPALKTEAALEKLRGEIREIKLYTGTLVSFDERASAILVGIPVEADRTRLYQAAREIIEPRQSFDQTIRITGAPVAEALLGLHILEDLGVPQFLLGTSTHASLEKNSSPTEASLGGLRLWIARKIGLVPVALAVMVLLFLLSFRNVPAALLPMPGVGAALCFTFGCMGYLGVPVYLTIAVMPVLLTAMGVTDEIHVFTRYFVLLRQSDAEGHISRIEQTMNELCRPVVNTSLTTAIGFVGFTLSPLAPVRAFGAFTALGVLFCLVWSMSVIPALLVLIPPQWLLSRRTQPGFATAAFQHFGRVARTVMHYRYWALGVVTLIVVLLPLGLRRVVVQDSWIDGFDAHSEFRLATQAVNEQFHGMHLLLLHLDAKQTLKGELNTYYQSPNRFVLPNGMVEDPGQLAGSRLTLFYDRNTTPQVRTNINSLPRPHYTHIERVESRGDVSLISIPRQHALQFQPGKNGAPTTLRFEVDAQRHLNPKLMGTLEDLADFVREQDDCKVGGVIGPADYVATTRLLVKPTIPNARSVPDEASEIKLMWDYYRIARGEGRLRQVVNSNYAESVTTVFLREANFQDTARLLDKLRDYEKGHLTPKGMRLGFAGDVAVSQSLIRDIVTTQLQSLGWALLGIFAVVCWMGRSWRWGWYCVLPSTLAVTINFAAMGILGIPLGVATSMFAGMTLGIGVDFAVHVLEGYRDAHQAGLSPSEAVTQSVSRTGPAVLINTVAVAVGFGVLMLSQVPANARLGLLVALALVNCLIATLVLVPALLAIWPIRLQNTRS